MQYISSNTCIAGRELAVGLSSVHQHQIGLLEWESETGKIGPTSFMSTRAVATELDIAHCMYCVLYSQSSTTEYEQASEQTMHVAKKNRSLLEWIGLGSKAQMVS